MASPIDFSPVFSMCNDEKLGGYWSLFFVLGDMSPMVLIWRERMRASLASSFIIQASRSASIRDEAKACGNSIPSEEEQPPLSHNTFNLDAL